MKIAYIGTNRGTSLHRAKALKRLGHEVEIISPWCWLNTSKWTSRWVFLLGAIGNGIMINSKIKSLIHSFKPDLIFVNQGEFLERGLIRSLKNSGYPIVNYMEDNPFVYHSGLRFYNFLRAISYYDLIAMRKVRKDKALKKGAKKVFSVWMSADEIVHAPRALSKEQKQKYTSEVAFIGTWMPGRGTLLSELIKRGVPLSVWGDRWQKAPEWKIIKPYWRGPGLDSDAEYSAAVLGAKICLGLVSKGNQDLHTRRSMEIPALGTLFCAERTSEHEVLYEDGVEAVFWDDAQECADQCNSLLADEQRRKRIAQKGYLRVVKNNYFNESIMAEILDAVFYTETDRPIP